MSQASSSIGKFLGNAGAYTKHAVIATGIGSVTFVSNTREACIKQFHAKDTELEARRIELRANRVAALAAPKVVRQRKLATA